MTDSQRWDMCGCYRETGLSTPNIDRLAEMGTRFEYAYTTQPVCQPARAGIFFGQYPSACGSWANSMGVSDNSVSIGRRLSDFGIHTAYIGKWHLDGGDYFGLGKCPAGWDENYWYDMRNYLEELTPEERVSSRRTEIMDERDVEADFLFGRRCADKAINFIKNCRDEKFFLAVSFDEPHGPCLCPQPFASMYEDYAFPKSKNVYDNLKAKPDYQRVWAGDSLGEDKDAIELRDKYYFGCNSYVDHEIGRVLDAAYANAPDALIIYTSDHGHCMSSHSLSAKGPSVYDEIARVPLIIAGFGLPKNTVNKNPASHINIAPTVMELMGFEIPNMMHGKSLAAELRDNSKRTNENIFIEFGRFEVDHDSFGGLQLMRACFDGRHKLSVNLLSTDELYDIQDDPDEMINLIDSEKHEAIRNRLHDAILANMNEIRDPFRGYYWERRPWRTDAAPPTWRHTGMTRQRIEDERYEKRQLDYNDGLEIKEAVRKK